MGTQRTTGIARRRATVRRGIIAALVAGLPGDLHRLLPRDLRRPPPRRAEHGAASVVAPVQEVATRAVQPFRDAWGWATSLKDARDRAASLQTEVDELRGQDGDNPVRDQRLAELESLLGVDALSTPARRRRLPRRSPAWSSQRSVTDWYRTRARERGHRRRASMRNSPVVAGTGTRRGPGRHRHPRQRATRPTSPSSPTGAPRWAPRSPRPATYPGLVQSTTPGQLQLTGVPREARGARGPGRRDGAASRSKNLASPSTRRASPSAR